MLISEAIVMLISEAIVVLISDGADPEPSEIQRAKIQWASKAQLIITTLKLLPDGDYKAIQGEPIIVFRELSIANVVLVYWSLFEKFSYKYQMKNCWHILHISCYRFSELANFAVTKFCKKPGKLL